MNMKKRIFALLVALTMVLGNVPAYVNHAHAHAEEAECTFHEAFCGDPDTCINCGKTTADGIMMDAVSHLCEFGADDHQHWDVCACGEISSVSEHVAWCTNPTVCYVCDNYVIGETITPVITQENIRHSNTSYEWDAVHHWKICNDCGTIVEESMQHQETCDNQGVCSVCYATEAGDGITIDICSHSAYDPDTLIKTEEGHGHGCSDCGYQEFDAHAETCANPGVCADCGMTEVEGAVMARTYHAFDTSDVKYDANQHWYECVDCGAQDYFGEHWAECENPNVCADCGLNAAEYGVEFHVEHNVNWETPNKVAEGHGFACADCDYSILDPHFARCTATDTCETCGMTEAEGAVITELIHVYSDAYVTSETTHGQHCVDCGDGWDELHCGTCMDPNTCRDCGMTTAEGAVMDWISHDWDWDHVSKEPEGHGYVCLNCGEKDFNGHYAFCDAPDTCYDCGMTVAQGAVLEWVDHWIDWGNPEITDESHTYVCEDCGYVEEGKHWRFCNEEGCGTCGATDVTFGYMEHEVDWEHYEYDQLNHFAQCGACGEIVYSSTHWADCQNPDACVECGATTADGIVIQYSGHSYNMEDMEYDQNYHWAVCEDCGEVVERTTHWSTCVDPTTCYMCGASDVNMEDAVGHQVDIGKADENGHEVVCVDCGMSYVEPHYATCQQPDKCISCGYIGGVIEIEHSYNRNEPAGFDQYEHWFICAVCGEEANRGMHATVCDKPNYCTICKQSNVIIDEVHHYEKAKSDETYHWTGCTLCDYVADKEEHAAQCTLPGECYVCGKKGEFPEYHTAGTLVETVAASCLQAGYESWTCGDCGLEWKVELEALEHDWEIVSTQPSNCLEAGTVEKQCTVCGEKNTMKVEATGHAFGAYAALGNGIHQAQCGNCGFAREKACEFNAVSIGGLNCELCAVCGYLRYALQPAEGEAAAEDAETQVTQPVEKAVVEALDENAVPENAQLVVYNQTSLLPEEADVKAVFTLGLTLDGETLPLEGKVKVQLDWEELTGEAILELTEEEIADLMTAYRLVLIQADGTMIEVEYEIVDGQLVFETEQTGTFALVPVEDV